MLALKRVALVGLGVVLACVMGWLGLWQMSAYQHSGTQLAVARTKLETVSLLANIASDGTVADIYARRVSVSGSYRENLSVLVGSAWPLRVVTAFETDDGRLVAVVRGNTSDGSVPAPLAGPRTITGIYLASDREATVGPGLPEGTLGSVRMSQIAQRWPGKVIAGYVTISDSAARAQGLAAPTLTLPQAASGKSQNYGYALQWWVFAAAALGGSVWIARSLK